MKSKKNHLNENVVEDIIISALDTLLLNDYYLLQVNINERTLTHRLAIYLENVFKGWNIDCEYNRNHNFKKQLQIDNEKTDIDDLEAKTVFPDIIIHHRGTDDNFVVVEVKKDYSNATACDFDKCKLKLYKEQLKYTHAVFIKIKTNVGEIRKPFKDYYIVEFID